MSQQKNRLWLSVFFLVGSQAQDIDDNSTICAALYLQGGIDDFHCQATNYNSSCRGGFYFSPTAGRIQNCTDGFFCPEGFICKIKCVEGSFCGMGKPWLAGQTPCGKNNKWKTNTCMPYNTPIDKKLGCGGASILFPCPEAYYCPDPTVMKECPPDEFCRSGAVIATPCQILTTCGAGCIGSPTGNYGGIVIVVISFILFFVGLWGLGKFQVNMKQKRRDKREANIQQQMLEIGLLDTPKNFLASNLKAFSRKDFKVDITFDSMGLELKTGGKKVLDCVSGTFYGGRVTAIMGPSGAGKSSLLAALSGKASSYANITGKILVNGYETPLTKFKPLTGFVPQEDTMLAELTVEEILMFSAQWRLPQALARKEMNDCVRHILGLMQLEEHRDTIIGDGETRGVSGGQKKRVNIGMEMVSDPTILFLDEPTSGLDSTTSQVVMDSLKQCAQLGTAVVVVLHQPRFEIFDMFDDVMILGKGGRTIYLGSVKQAVPYYESIGFNLPQFVNPADFIMDVCSGATKQGNSDFHENPTKYLAEMWQRNRGKFDSDSKAQSDQTVPVRVTPSFTWQIWLCFRRSAKQFQRTIYTELSDVMLVMFAGCVVGLMFSGVDLDKVPRVNFMVMLAVSIMGVQQSLRLFGNERLVYWREAASGINRFSYFFGKTVFALLTVPVLPLAFLAFFMPFSAPRASTVDYLKVLLPTQFASQGLGHLISVVLAPNQAQLAGVVLTLVMGMVSGSSPTLKQLDDMGFLGTVAYSVSYLRYVLEALFIVETTHYPAVFDTPIAKSRQLIGYCDSQISLPDCMQIKQTLPDSMLALFLFGLAFHFATLLALMLLNRSKQI